RGEIHGFQRRDALRRRRRWRADRAGGTSCEHAAIAGALARGADRARATGGHGRCEQGQAPRKIYQRLIAWREHGDVSSGLWIIVLEAGCALALLVALVWWTLPKRPRSTGNARDARKESSPPR